MSTDYEWRCLTHGESRESGVRDPQGMVRLVERVRVHVSLFAWHAGSDIWDVAFGYTGNVPLSWVFAHATCDVVVYDSYGFTYDRDGKVRECENRDCWHLLSDHVGGTGACSAKSIETESPCPCQKAMPR